MKRVTRFLARLYPTSWRKRYGDEFDALLGDTEPTARDAFDVFKGAVTMQFSTWTFARVTTAGVIIGVVGGAVIGFSIPSRWISQATLVVSADRQGLDALGVIENVVLSSDTLARLIQIDNLYPAERTRQPLYDVIDNMRRHIQLLPAKHLSPAIYPFEITFEYPDRMVSQRVVQDLAYDFTHIRGRPDLPENAIELLERPTQPTGPVYPNRLVMLGEGLGVGLLGGVMLAAFISSRRRTELCPTCGQRVTASQEIADGPGDLPSAPGEML